MIQFDHVSVVYPGGTPALNNVSLHIKKGEFVFVLGRSGAGKSTFLSLIRREVKATEGEVYVDGKDVAKIKDKNVPYLRRKMGIVFQDFRLIRDMTVYENVAFSMRVTNIPEETIVKRVPYALERVGLTGKEDKYPDQLSGGEQQRVGLARAVVHGPQLIIADEPTGNIDPELSNEIMELLTAINQLGITMVVVTHEHELARRYGKRIITIDDGEVVTDTDPETFFGGTKTEEWHEEDNVGEVML